MTARKPWDDARLTNAYAALATRVPVPRDLVATTTVALASGAPARRPWRRLLAAAAVVALAVGAVGGGALLVGGLGPGPTGGATFRDGPTPGLRTLHAGEFTLDFPAEWLAYDASMTFSGGSSIAVLGTQPVEVRCGDERHVDMNCVYEQPIEPGEIRVVVGTGAYRGGTVFDRADIENGLSRRLEVGGMPAILDVRDPQPDSFYRENVALDWSIARPTLLSNVVTIEVRARGWPVAGTVPTGDEVIAALAPLIDSFRFTPPPADVPLDPTAAANAARAAIRERADGFRRGYVPDDDADAMTYLDCLGDRQGTASTARVSYGPGGDLGRPVALECSWTIRPETAVLWRLDLAYVWTVGGRFGRYVETHWLDSSGTVLGGSSAGDPPPADDAGPTTPSEVLALPVITVSDAIAIRDVGVDARELAVRGWFSPIVPISCPGPVNPPTSPVEPVCPDPWVLLTELPESLVEVLPNGMTGSAPTGPAIQVDLDDLDSAWQPRLPSHGSAIPAEVVFIGHFDDRRSSWCPPEVEQDCRDRFVVDRVDWVDGAAQPLSVIDRFDGPAESTVDQVLGVLAAEEPGLDVLSVVLVDGPGMLPQMEPSLAGRTYDVTEQRAVWVVRFLRDGYPTTYLKVDGRGTTYRFAEDGSLVKDVIRSGPILDWPPAGATVIALTSPVGVGRPPVQVAIDDRSGRVTAVREVRAEDPIVSPDLGGEWAAFVADPGTPGRYRLVWVGGMCDSRFTIFIDAAFTMIARYGGNAAPCDAMAIARHLVIDVAGSLDPETVATGQFVAAPTIP